jgi:hypothetical protein
MVTIQDEVEQGEHAYYGEYLIGMTFWTTFIQSLKIVGQNYPTQYLLGSGQPREMTTTCSSMEVIQNSFNFLMDKEMT